MGIRDEQHGWKVQPEEISLVLTEYYRNLFSSSRSSSSNGVLAHVPQVITDKMNASLTSEFMKSEVVVALQQMAPLKVPGSDEMPPLFFQHFWSTVDKDVTSSILSWLNLGILPHPINHTFITLIPKTNNPEYVHQYRLISLCNVLYKIFSKVLANCLKTLLPTIITEHQLAFTKDKLISDNILVTLETLHCMHKHNSGTLKFMALKLDMSKTYDRVEWAFLEDLIRKMGFNERWINLTMICVKTITYSILVNGELSHTSLKRN